MFLNSNCVGVIMEEKVVLELKSSKIFVTENEIFQKDRKGNILKKIKLEEIKDVYTTSERKYASIFKGR